MAFDFSSGLAEICHPTTGIATFIYPLSWLGDSEYYLREVMGPAVDVPPWLGNDPRRVIRIRHESADVCDPVFIRSAYGAPCVSGEHPGIWHAAFARLPKCGLVGTSHELRPSRNGKGLVPYVPAICDDPIIAQQILDGNLESSLAYNYALEWAPEGSDYDARHVLGGGNGMVNHLLINIPPGRSRGGVRAGRAMDMKSGHGFWDHAREASQKRTIAEGGRYHESGPNHMKRITLCFPAMVALDLAKPDAVAKDGTLELPDDAMAALAVAAPALGALSTALGEATKANEEMATKVGELETAATETAAVVADLTAQVAAADAAMLPGVIKTAAILGYACPMGKDGKPEPVTFKNAAGKDASRPRTCADIREAAVLAKNGRTTYDSMAVMSRPGYVAGAWESLCKGLNGRSVVPIVEDTKPPTDNAAGSAARVSKLLHRPNQRPNVAKAPPTGK